MKRVTIKNLTFITQMSCNSNFTKQISISPLLPNVLKEYVVILLNMHTLLFRKKSKIKSLNSKGYNFKSDHNKKPFYDNQELNNIHEIKRVLKLRFKCKNNRCPQFKKINEQAVGRKWTTYYGVTQCSIYFDDQDVMRYQFKVYGQKCQTCKIWGSGSVIQNEMLDLARIYGIVIENIINQSQTLQNGIILTSDQKNGRAPQKKQKIVGRVLQHREELCEACLYRKCIYFYRKKAQGRGRSRSQVDD